MSADRARPNLWIAYGLVALAIWKLAEIFLWVLEVRMP